MERRQYKSCCRANAWGAIRPERGKARARFAAGSVLSSTLSTLMLIAVALVPGQPLAAAQVNPTVLAAPIVFPGATRGVAATQAPLATDFTVHCNVHASTEVGHVGGRAIPVGTALLATTGCGEAVLLMSVPGRGRFQATFGIADDETSGQPATMRVHVLGRDGTDLRFATVTVTRVAPVRLVDIDVSGGGAIILDFLKAPKTFLYAIQLTGAARALRSAAGDGSGVPAGAAPTNIAGAARSCNAYAVTQPLTASGVPVVPARSVTLSGCGQVTLALAPGTQGTLVLRYGMSDTAGAGISTLSVRVFAPSGQLLRKAIGVAFLGSGLRPLWVSLRGGSTATIAVTGDGSNPVAVTAVGMLPGQMPLYSNAAVNRVIAAGAAGTSATLYPEAFISSCNAYVGSGDISVGRLPVFSGTYISAPSGCGSTRLVFAPLADGTVHALFGVPDDAPGGAQPTVTVVATAKDNTPLYRRVVHAPYGAPGVAIDVPLRYGNRHVSVLSFATFTGAKSVLYDMQIRGLAAAYSLLYPPLEPPLSTSGGVAVAPRDFALQCNAYLGKDDQYLVGETALEGWSLTGLSCGEADLTLAGTPYPRHLFSARIGMENHAPPTAAVTVRLAVVAASGTILRSKDFTVRYGYGPLLDPRISLAGGTKLKILWGAGNADATVAVYAMTAS